KNALSNDGTQRKIRHPDRGMRDAGRAESRDLYWRPELCALVPVFLFKSPSLLCLPAEPFTKHAWPHSPYKRQRSQNQRSRGYPFALGSSRQFGAHRNEIRLWRRTLWCLHCSSRRRCCSVLLNPSFPSRGKEHHDYRGAVERRPAAGMDRRAGSPMRILADRTDHGSRSFARQNPAAYRRSNHPGDDRQLMPMWHLRSHPPSHPSGSRRRKMTPLSRRDFLTVGAAAGAGLVIGFYLPHGSSKSGDMFAPNAYLKIAPDGKVTIVVARSEMGQGVRTSLPMILAEELEADWKQIAIEQAGASTLYGDQTTGGSASVRTTWDPMRKAGAAAREMLISAAALEWGVPRASCKAQNSAIIHPDSNRRLGYGQLASKAASLPIPTDPPLKQAKDYELVGKPLPRLD